MNGKFSYATRDNVVRLSLILSIILFFVSSALVGFTYFFLPPLIPFFNSFAWGYDRLAPSYYAFFLPVVFLICIIINFFTGVFFYNKFTIVARILSVNVFLIIFFGFLAYLQILLLVF